MIDRLTEEQLVEIKKELARRDFFYFCVLMAPDFYKENRQYLIDFCNELQEFYFSDDDVLVINAPPRHGKSRTSQLFAEWVFGINPSIKVMTGSYNETLSTTFSKGVRNDIQAMKGDKDKIIYSDIFPDTKIKRGDGAMNLWSLEGHYNNYLATSPTGTATGFGCNLLLIDDLIKNSEEAYNENTLDKHWEWFTNTMLSRLEESGKIIIIMTRWSSKDLAGRALDYFSEIGMKVRHINLKAVQDDGTMLCEEILSKKSYDLKVSAMGQDIASANYQQEPIDMKGRLYERFLTYDKLPCDSTGTPLFTAIKNYTDTADTGADYLCSICYGVYNKEIYILDVLYTKESMETTEIKTAELLYRNNIKRADIESNNGGRGFARNVARIMNEKYPDNTTVIKTFTQHKNKEARILTNSPYVMNHVFFPVGWENKWREFYKALYEYQREGKNAHDDACFVKGTMIATLTGNKPIEKVKKGEYVITPFGIRKVLENKMTGEKNVITNIGLTGTPNHKIFSKEGVFKELDTFTGVAECDMISLRGAIKWKYQKLLNSMVSNTNLWGRESIISANQIQMKDENMLKDFMLQFGNFIIKRKFQKVTKFTIKTVIILITTLIIWSVYQLGNIIRNILLKMKNLINSYKQDKKHGKNGIKVKKVKNGILNMLKNNGKIKKKLKNNVRNVGKYLKQSKHGQNIVATYVVKSGEENIKELHTREIVSYVEKNSKQQNKNPHQKKDLHVAGLAQINSITKIEKRKVYNLSVEKDHVYYANGLLVSNCDALTGCVEKSYKKGVRVE